MIISLENLLRLNFNTTKPLLAGLGLAFALIGSGLSVEAAQTPVDLRTAARFAVLGGSGVSSIPTSAIIGDVGLSPAARSKITGLTGVEVVGGIYAADDGGAVAAMLSAAQGDLNTAFIDASPAVRPNGVDVSTLGGAAGELGGRTLAPGLYKSAPGSYDITSLDLTLDAGGDANAVWIFQMSTTLHVFSNRKVILAGNAQARNVFWQVGSSATISTYSAIKGTIMAAQSVALQTSATLEGRAMAQSGAVTLDANSITTPSLRPVPPSFGPISRASDGTVTLIITNTPGLTLTIQSSSTLTNWVTLTTPTPGVSPDTYNDAAATGQPRRFYRAFYP